MSVGNSACFLSRKQGQSHIVSAVMVIAGLVLIACAPFVSYAVPLLTQLDADGHISKPYLFARPLISIATVLIGTGVLRSALMARSDTTLEAQVLADRRSRIIVGLSVVFVAVLAATYVYAVLGRPVYETIFAEDGPPEYLTAALCFTGVAAYLVALRRYLVQSDRMVIPVAFMLLGFTLSLFLGLEEISYGQRIFGWATPEAMAANIQHESNLHNFLSYSELDVIEWLGSAAVFVTCCVIIFIRATSNWRMLKFAPGANLLPLTAGVAVFASYGWFGEVFENSTALFLMLYGLQLARQTGEARGA
ncbi:hypothetical protein [Hyphomicrobium sp. NDB2Meth4]|uniref:hypothetical protein n=1 Tax=Hyphomicrobium sp. NDB2Meth4 TaxID=1892846 RepID=UPI000AB944E3|nr:hypothetical protein [Hyphomicrobium sp. NDB2Meth4]